MSSQTLSSATYLVVLVALMALTVLTVGISFTEISGTWHVAMGLLVASVKASLVGLVYMHLIHSRSTNWTVVVISVFWLSVVLILLAFSDYGTRSWFPFTPGH